MKKFKSVFRKIMLTIVLLSGYFLIGGSIKSETAASSYGAEHATRSHLLRENMELKENYAKLEQRLQMMEEQLNEIVELDNNLYAELMGVDYDTTDFYMFRNDSAAIVISQNDSMFNAINERSLYAAELLALQLEKLQHTSEWFKNNKSVIYYYPTISPIKTSHFIRVSSPYGWRQDPVTGKNAYHEGLDISANPGTEVYATASGRIDKILYSKYGYGNRVVIRHAYGFQTLYAHLGVINVKKGQWINKGQKIGTVGNTGKSTGPHLHYEISKNGKPRDPMGYFYTHITGELLAMN
jgi:murein DD-endopeptidase MepM/ murein hydrolase activator NlpD